jgi:hypothetical protein
LSSIMSPITAILESCLNILFLRIVLYIHQKYNWTLIMGVIPCQFLP